MTNRLKILLVAACGAWLILAAGAQAVPGDLDRSFSGDGRATAFFKHWRPTGVAADLARTSDGGYVAATEVWTRTGRVVEEPALARFTADGWLDRSFSSDGQRVIHTAGADYTVQVATQGKKTLVMSDALNAASVIRVTSAGRVDDSFGDNGTARIPSIYPAEILVLPSGKVLVGGTASGDVEPPDRDFAVARLLRSGRLDPSFGSQGIAKVDLRAPSELDREGDDVLAGLAIEDDGRIVASGTSSLNGDSEAGLSYRSGVAVVGLLADGSIDPRFGEGGVAVLGPEAGEAQRNGSAGAAVAFSPEGEVVVAGDNFRDLVVSRLTEFGEVDPSFGGDGTVQLDAGAPEDLADAVAVGPGRQIFLAGSTRGPTSTDVLVAGVSPSGILDPRFSRDGLKAIEFGGQYDDADAIQIQPNGRIVAAATVGSGRIGLVRLLSR